MAANSLLFSKDIISGIKLRYKRSRITRYRRHVKRIIHLRIKNKGRRNLYGPSQLIKIYNN